MIHVDPRFTRTSALADIYAPIRAGSDIAFLGGLINYILERDLWFKDYALNYTNLSTIIDARFQDASALDGLFSGFDPDSRSYKYDPWQYQGEEVPSSLAEHYVNTTESFSEKLRRMEKGPPPRDPTLQHPNTVYQILKRHYAVYTPEKVEETTGCPRDDLSEDRRSADPRFRARAHCGVLLCGRLDTPHGRRADDPRRRPDPGLARQHRPARRRHPGIARPFVSIQGSTDIPTLYNMLPSYLPQPHAGKPHETLKEYLEAETPPTGFWHNFPEIRGQPDARLVWRARDQRQWMGLSAGSRASSATIRNCR